VEKLAMSGLSRRGFLKSSSLLLGGLAAQQLISKTGLSLVSAQTALGRPLRMLALGDSVMWGQGLLDENKFSHLVKKWLVEDKSIAGVDLKVMAHSGASISVDSDMDKDSKWRCMDGEIPRHNPTITKQVSLAAEYYCGQKIPLEDVDLILLDGGINDIDKRKFFRVSTRVGRIRNMASQYCDVEMKKLLYYLASTFPNARIIVTGYFPLITCSTPPATIPHLVMEALGLKQPPPPQIIELVEKSIPKDDAEPKDYCKGLHPILRRLSLLSEAWRRESNAAFCRAAKWINETRPWTGKVNPALACAAPSAPPKVALPPATLELCADPLLAGAPVSRNRVFFAPPEFRNQNGYGVPTTSYLWKLVPNKDPIPCTDGFLKEAQRRIISEDELHDNRPCWCCEAGEKNDVFCVRGGAFHPNTLGAKAYRDAIVKELGKVYADTGWGDAQWGTAPPSPSDHSTTGVACQKIPCPD
jgi:lysophospholipase L1-like esterase